METVSVRERLLEAAAELFAAEGYDAVGVEKLRTRAGVSNGSFFHLFAAKEDLAAELLVSYVADYQSAIVRAVARSDHAAAGLEAIVRAHIRWVINNRSKARFMLDDARAAWFTRATERLRELNTAFAGAIERWRAPLIDDGSLRDVPVEVFFATVIGPANLICRTWIAGQQLSAASPTRHEDDLVMLAHAALVVTPARSANKQGRKAHAR